MTNYFYMIISDDKECIACGFVKAETLDDAQYEIEQKHGCKASDTAISIFRFNELDDRLGFLYPGPLSLQDLLIDETQFWNGGTPNGSNGTSN